MCSFYSYNPYLAHYGIKRKSGRYPWGSGKRPHQHEVKIFGRKGIIKDFKKKVLKIAGASMLIGMASVDIALLASGMNPIVFPTIAKVLAKCATKSVSAIKNGITNLSKFKDLLKIAKNTKVASIASQSASVATTSSSFDLLGLLKVIGLGSAAGILINNVSNDLD